MGLSREQRGLGRLKLVQRQPTSYMTRTPLSRTKGQRSRSQGAGAYCGGILHSLLHSLLFITMLLQVNKLHFASGAVQQMTLHTKTKKVKMLQSCVKNDDDWTFKETVLMRWKTGKDIVPDLKCIKSDTTTATYNTYILECRKWRNLTRGGKGIMTRK